MTPGYEFNYSMAGSWEAPAPQPLGHSGYMTVSVFPSKARESHPLILDFVQPSPSVQYNTSAGQGGTDYYGPRYDFTANQFPDPTVPFPYILFGAHNNQGAFLVWRLHNVWVSYAGQDELHVTIAFRRIRSL